jgi:hypothetical protein
MKMSNANETVAGKTLSELAGVDFGSSYPIMELQNGQLVCTGVVDGNYPQEFNEGNWHIVDDLYAMAD